MSVLTDEGIDETALSDVGSSHDSEAWYAILDLLPTLSIEFFEHLVEQVSCAASCCRADAHGVAESQFVELCRLVVLVEIVGLVGHENDGQF